MTNSLINQIKSATTRKDVHELLSTRSVEVRQTFLSNAIDSLNKEIECDILDNNIDVAIFKMSQVVMLEDEKHAVERVILKQSVVVR